MLWRFKHFFLEYYYCIIVVSKKKQIEFSSIICCVYLPWVVLLHQKGKNTKSNLENNRNLSGEAFIESL